VTRTARYGDIMPKKKVANVQRARHKTVEKVRSATPPKYRERVTRSHPPQATSSPKQTC